METFYLELEIEHLFNIGAMTAEQVYKWCEYNGKKFKPVFFWETKERLDIYPKNIKVKLEKV